jgi:tetratricopeptide (TPR) repeat protein
MEYIKDYSLTKYSTETLGNFMTSASREQISAIENVGFAIGRGLNVLSNKMDDVNQELIFLNRNMDLQLEQNKLTNYLLQNIQELLRIPESEKERQKCIELGVKFFIKAKEDLDFYEDSLEEFKKAEILMKQDYFVLHIIGIIHLYVERYLDPKIALDYFLKSAKYAILESSSNNGSLIKLLLNTTPYYINELKKINPHEFLASDSYEKAAFAAYVLGQFEDSVKYQQKAIRILNTPQRLFILAKYQMRIKETSEALKNLTDAIDSEPILCLAIFKEVDLFSEETVINLIKEKNNTLDNKLNSLIESASKINSSKAKLIAADLTHALTLSYEKKTQIAKNCENLVWELYETNVKMKGNLDNLIWELQNSVFLTFNDHKIQRLSEAIEISKTGSIEEMQSTYDSIKKGIDNNKLKIGSKYLGGTVFYIDSTGKHGLICLERTLNHHETGKSNFSWWGRGESHVDSHDIQSIGAHGNGIADDSGMENTKKITSTDSWKEINSLFTKKRIPTDTAASICLGAEINGYSDWYLPTINELIVLFRNIGESSFKVNPGINSYWSSTEYNGRGNTPTGVWAYCCKNNKEQIDHKSECHHVIPIRRF